jgi:pimeloyl-ACP methyl ester carboxylesterase
MQIVVDGIITNYTALETSTSKDVLLVLPGWMEAGSLWTQIGDALKDKYKVLILDFPGFGISQTPAKVFDTYAYADFVKKFLLKLKVTDYSIIGHSFGGRVGIILAATDSNVSRLVLVDSAGIEKRSLYVKVKILINKAVKIILGKYLFHGGYTKNPTNMRKTFVKVVNQDLTQLLAKIKIPALIVWGEKDKILNIKYARAFHKLISGSKLRVVWGAGHFPQLDKTEQLIEILSDYL